jgi:hypothetical protein
MTLPSQRRLPSEEPAYPFTTRQNWLIALVCIVGACLIVIPGKVGASEIVVSALRATGWVIEGLLLVVVLSVAFRSGHSIPGVPRRGSGERFKPVPFLGFVAFVVAAWTIAFTAL